jgi:hypothetical protein
MQNFTQCRKRQILEPPAAAPEPEKVYNENLGSISLEYEAEVIRDSKMEGEIRYYLIKWVGWPEKENTWEPEEYLINSRELIAEFDEAFPEKP